LDRKSDEKLKCRVMSLKSLIHILVEVTISFERVYLLNTNVVIVLTYTTY